jgi:hypothetical protein
VHEYLSGRGLEAHGQSVRILYIEIVLQRLSARLIPLSSRAADVAPVAPACCNVCRTCVTTNVVGVVTGGIVAATLAIRRRVRRAPAGSS